MEKRKEIIAFDVDGVIFDSTEECLVIAWNAHQELIGKDEKISHPSEAKEDYDLKFRSIRNYVRSMDEYLVIFYGNISENPDQKDFEECLNSILSIVHMIVIYIPFFDYRKTLYKVS